MLPEQLQGAVNRVRVQVTAPTCVKRFFFFSNDLLTRHMLARGHETVHSAKWHRETATATGTTTRQIRQIRAISPQERSFFARSLQENSLMRMLAMFRTPGRAPTKRRNHAATDHGENRGGNWCDPRATDHGENLATDHGTNRGGDWCVRRATDHGETNGDGQLKDLGGNHGGDQLVGPSATDHGGNVDVISCQVADCRGQSRVVQGNPVEPNIDATTEQKERSRPPSTFLPDCLASI